MHYYNIIKKKKGGKKMVEKLKYPLNSLYGVSSMSHSSNVRTDTNLKNAEITAKLITNRDGFLYADTDGIYHGFR